MALTFFMYNTAFILGALAAGYWFLRGQSIRKGLGFTFHWWSIGDLIAGVLITGIAMAGIFLVEWLIGAIRVTGFAMNWDALQQGFRLQSTVAPFEEILSRSMQLPGLQIALALLLSLVTGKRLGDTYEQRMDAALRLCVWPAILIISAVFGYVHIQKPSATPISAFGNALGGLMYGIAFMGGRNLWLPIGLHFGWNFIQGNIFGFPVSGDFQPSLITLQTADVSPLLSGGAYGPEGGLIGMTFRFVVIALVLLYLYLRAGRRGNVAALEFPIKEYANPPRPHSTLIQDKSQGATQHA